MRDIYGYYRDEEDRWSRDKAAMVARYMNAFQLNHANQQHDNKTDSTGITIVFLHKTYTI
jgi:hypothetical protein